MGSYGSSYGFFAGISILSLICGIIVIVGAVMLRAHDLGYPHHCVFSR
jgi:hypothetical protein